MALAWNHTKDHNRSRKLCFHHSGQVPVIRGNPAMVLAVITWIGRVYELYSGASPISLVEHCVTFRHDRRLLSLLGFVHHWPTSRWSTTKKKKKKKKKRKENRFSLNGNGIMSSFLGRQFYCSTLYIYIYIYIKLHIHWPFFFKKFLRISFIIILIIIKSRWQPGFLRLSLCLCLSLSLSICPYHSSLLTDSPNFIHCLHKIDVRKS